MQVTSSCCGVFPTKRSTSAMRGLRDRESTRRSSDLFTLDTFLPKANKDAFGFEEHAGDVVVLRGIPDEEVDFGHEALEHFLGLDRFASFNRGQQAGLAVVFLAGVFGFH